MYNFNKRRIKFKKSLLTDNILKRARISLENKKSQIKSAKCFVRSFSWTIVQRLRN